MKIELRLTIRNNMGDALKTYSKDVESEFTPSKEMIFSGEDYTLESPKIYFDLDDGSVLLWFSESPHEDEKDGWNFLLNEGWDNV